MSRVSLVERLLYEAMKLKPRLFWRMQDVRHERVVEYLPKRFSISDWNQPTNIYRVVMGVEKLGMGE